jgi:hypothetical protein
MRKLNQICSQLPITERETYEKHAFTEYSDIASVNLLASITKGFELINELFDDYKTIHGKEGYGMMDPDDVMMHGGGGRYWDEDLIMKSISRRGPNKKMF